MIYIVLNENVTNGLFSNITSISNTFYIKQANEYRYKIYTFCRVPVVI